MHIFIHIQTRGICGKHHLHDSNVVGTVADFVDQNSSSEKEITRHHADVIISSFPSVSYNLFLFPLFSFKPLHGHLAGTDGSTTESIEKKQKKHLHLLSSPPTVLRRSFCATTPLLPSIPPHLPIGKQSFTACMCAAFRRSEVRLRRNVLDILQRAISCEYQ